MFSWFRLNLSNAKPIVQIHQHQDGARTALSLCHGEELSFRQKLRLLQPTIRTYLPAEKRNSPSLAFQEIAPVERQKAIPTMASLTKTTTTSMATIRMKTRENMWRTKFSRATKQSKKNKSRCKKELINSWWRSLKRGTLFWRKCILRKLNTTKILLHSWRWSIWLISGSWTKLKSELMRPSTSLRPCLTFSKAL